MSCVGLSDSVIGGTLILSSRMAISMLNDQGHSGNGSFPAGQHVILPGPGDSGNRIARRPTFHFYCRSLQDVQGGSVRDVVYPGRN